MQFNVSQLLKDPIGSIRNYELIEELDDLEEFETLNPLVGTVRMLRTHSGLLVSGELSTALRVTCFRCLEPVVMPVRFTLEEMFRPLTEVRTGRYIHPDEFEGTTAELEDAALIIDEQHMLNMKEVIRQHIWLAIPMNITCEKTGLEGCPDLETSLGGVEIGFALESKTVSEEGNNIILVDNMEEEVEAPIDPRWSALLALQGNTDHDQATPDNE